MTEEKYQRIIALRTKIDNQRTLVARIERIDTSKNENILFENSKSYLGNISSITVGQIKSIMLEVETKTLAQLEREYECL